MKVVSIRAGVLAVCSAMPVPARQNEAVALVQRAPPAPAAAPLVRWTAGEVRCGDETVILIAAVQPNLTADYTGITAEASLAFRFSIDANGRTRGITPLAARFVSRSDDLAPALAAKRFAAGRALADCTVAFSQAILSIDGVPRDELLGYVAVSASPRPPRAVIERMIPPRSTCFRPTGAAPLLRAYPTSARSRCVAISFRVSAMADRGLGGDRVRRGIVGEAGNVRVVASEPTDAFGQAARNLIASAKTEPSARGLTGCVEHVRFVIRGSAAQVAAVPDDAPPVDRPLTPEVGSTLPARRSRPAGRRARRSCRG